jgi:putative hydrolase of the HAD superfamily
MAGSSEIRYAPPMPINDAPVPRAMIFDLGGTLVDYPEWDEDAPRRWALSWDALTAALPHAAWPPREAYVAAMRAAELAHWKRVDLEQWSGPPSGVLRDGFARLGRRVHETELAAALDGYARAVDGWGQLEPGARETLLLLRERGYPLGLLSNTWWAAGWHNADLAAHGLSGLLDELVYTSDLPHSKPHPSVFLDVAARLGVEPAACVMIGDRLIDDVTGALGVGMRAIWKENDRSWPRPERVEPSATVRHLGELPGLLRSWGGR